MISCGAISGFHATQSPLMARCMANEKYARPVFYGAMVSEGVVALIWATAAIAYFGGPEGSTPLPMQARLRRLWSTKSVIHGSVALVRCSQSLAWWHVR